jgi:hypothetical protein
VKYRHVFESIAQTLSQKAEEGSDGRDDERKKRQKAQAKSAKASLPTYRVVRDDDPAFENQSDARRYQMMASRYGKHHIERVAPTGIRTVVK